MEPLSQMVKSPVENLLLFLQTLFIHTYSKKNKKNIYDAIKLYCSLDIIGKIIKGKGWRKMKRILMSLLSLVLFLSAFLFDSNPSAANSDLTDEELTNLHYQQALEEMNRTGSYPGEIDNDDLNSVPPEAGSFSFKAGDILVTKSTDSSGLLGHTGIVLTNPKNVLHIRGPGAKPAVISINQWLSDYPATKVVRFNSSSRAYDAAKWASSNYVKSNGGRYSNLDYGFTGSIKGFKSTYCSKIVWQAYYYGAQKGYKVILQTPSQTKWIIPGIIAPYHYLNKSYQNYNGFKTVKSIKW